MKEFAIIFPCEKNIDFPMRTGFPASIQIIRLLGFLVIQMLKLLYLSGVKKNGMWTMRPSSPIILRPQDPKDKGSSLWRYSYLSRNGNTTCEVPEVCKGETREIAMDIEQSILYKAICIVCGEAMPVLCHLGCGQGNAFRLENSKRTGQAIYA